MIFEANSGWRGSATSSRPLMVSSNAGASSLRACRAARPANRVDDHVSWLRLSHEALELRNREVADQRADSNEIIATIAAMRRSDIKIRHRMEAPSASEIASPRCHLRCNWRGYCIHHGYCEWELNHTGQLHLCATCADEQTWVRVDGGGSIESEESFELLCTSAE